MKTFLKTVSMIAICLAATIQFSSCSSDNEDDVPTNSKYEVKGKWSVAEVDPIYPEIFDKELSLKFPTPFIEFESNGKMNWHECILMEARPSETKNHGTYIIKDDKITISAPGNAWMNGTHVIESTDKNMNS